MNRDAFDADDGDRGLDAERDADGTDTADDGHASDAREPSPATIPPGDPVSARTVGDLSVPLRTALDERVTGYLVVQPARSILLGERARAVVTFDDGVPVLAYETSGDVGGPDALAAVAGDTPARAELYRLDEATLAPFHDRRDCRVPPDAPALELADDESLAGRTRERAPDDRGGDAESAAAAFLADEDRIEAIRAEARSQAREHATEWGLTDQLAVDDSRADPPAGTERKRPDSSDEAVGSDSGDGTERPDWNDGGGVASRDENDG